MCMGGAPCWLILRHSLLNERKKKIAQAWPIRCGPDVDCKTVQCSSHWLEAIHRVKEIHSLVDDVNNVDLKIVLDEQKVQPGETTTSIIGRCRTMASPLDSLCNPVPNTTLTRLVGAMQ